MVLLVQEMVRAQTRQHTSAHVHTCTRAHVHTCTRARMRTCICKYTWTHPCAYTLIGARRPDSIPPHLLWVCPRLRRHLLRSARGYRVRLISPAAANYTGIM
eukprot:scaffold35011_cov57-Phaeocystis_antarctica.AAC.2